jgi:uncharacterized protein (TIGR00159 family)
MTELPLRPVEVVDLVIVWLLVWAAITWLRATPARVGLAGIGTLVAFYLLARLLGLTLTTWILQGFAAVAALTAIVVFQQDLRRLFEQIARAWFRSRDRPAASSDTVDLLTRAAANLAEHKRGALIVIPGRESIEGHVDGGLSLDAHLTEPLLLSLFDPNSPGHDGALIVDGDRGARFAVHLPLSTDHAQLGHRGTRHAAALGLSERTDALAIVVSEERGTISIAQGGRLRVFSAPSEIAAAIARHLGRTLPAARKRGPRIPEMFRHWRAGALALPIAALLWGLAVPGATNVDVERVVPVTLSGVPAGYELEGIEPESVRVTLAGRRRDLFLLPVDAVKVRVDAILVELGRRSFQLSSENVQHPEELRVVRIQPDKVKIGLREKSAPTAPPQSTK